MCFSADPFLSLLRLITFLNSFLLPVLRLRLPLVRQTVHLSDYGRIPLVCLPLDQFLQFICLFAAANPVLTSVESSISTLGRIQDFVSGGSENWEDHSTLRDVGAFPAGDLKGKRSKSKFRV